VLYLNIFILKTTPIKYVKLGMESFNTTNTKPVIRAHSDKVQHVTTYLPTCNMYRLPWAAGTQLIRQLKDLSSCLQNLASEFKPEPDESIYTFILCLYLLYFNITLPSKLRSPKLSLSLRFIDQNCSPYVHFLFSQFMLHVPHIK
jgi:hypothetical protein